MVGNGSFNYIPESGFVGTVFVNSLSNILMVNTVECKLHLKPLNGAVIP